MTSRVFRRRDEDGATLLFVIGFMVLAGFVAASLVTRISSTTLARTAFDTARNREYAADAAIETAIASTRSQIQASPQAACSGATILRLTSAQALNGVAVQVDCVQPAATITLSGNIERIVDFTACPLQLAGHQCPATASIVNAQVNFVSKYSLAATSIQVDSTAILSWSVNS